jgi:hypothetical protein
VALDLLVYEYIPTGRLFIILIETDYRGDNNRAENTSGAMIQVNEVGDVVEVILDKWQEERK